MSWWFLVGAIGAEVLATGSLRAAAQPGATWAWWIGVAGGYASAFGLLYAALSHDTPLSSAYAIWSGVGVALTAVVAWLVFGERLTPGAMVGIALIVAGVVLVEAFGHSSGVSA
ncbi:DMT family transporter [Microbacterium sp.]|uniref:DMT family transporter n=1 Tax=Microbacterium sp. TaxID=51671 RepID=UPI003C78357A